MEILIISKKGIHKTYKTKEKNKPKAIIKVLERFLDENSKDFIKSFEFEGITIK